MATQHLWAGILVTIISVTETAGVQDLQQAKWSGWCARLSPCSVPLDSQRMKAWEENSRFGTVRTFLLPCIHATLREPQIAL